MHYYKTVESGYILSIGMGEGGNGISRTEYEELAATIAAKPHPSGSTDYRLRTDLTWEPFAIEPQPTETEINNEEALEIILGGAT